MCFLPKEVPLAFVVKLVWCCWILLTFACLENFWFLHQMWVSFLMGRVFLVVGSSLSSLEISCAILFWFLKFLLKKSADNLMGVPMYVICHFSLVALNPDAYQNYLGVSWKIQMPRYVFFFFFQSSRYVSNEKESESEVAQSGPTLFDPVDRSLPGSSIHGILQARILEWVAISFSRGSSWPRDLMRSHV